MSGEAQKTDYELEEQINKDLEAAADEAFGSDEEIAKQAAEAADKNPDSGAPAEETSNADTPAEDGAGAGEPIEGTQQKEGGDQKADDKDADGETSDSKDADSAEPDQEDPYNVPKDMKGRTRERFEKLTGDLKESHQRIEKQTEIIQGFRSVLQESGMNPKELQSAIDLGSLLKRDPKAALVEMKGIVSSLSESLGEVPPGVDPLEGFEDLKRQVEDRELSQEMAEEIATARIRKAADAKRYEAQKQQEVNQQTENEQQKRLESQVNNAREDVAKFLKSAEADPDFKKIAPHLLAAADHMAKNLDPSAWLDYIKKEYQKVKDIASAMQPSDPGPSPILDGGAPPGGQQEPQTMEQLADQML